MRLHVGAAMPLKGGRPAIAVAEVREGRVDGTLRFQFRVGFIDRVVPYGVQDARDRLIEVVTKLEDQRPCVIVDAGSPQGLALHQQLKPLMPRTLHRPHAYPGTGSRGPLFSSFLQAYADGRLTFEPDLEHRTDLDRSLVFFGGTGVKKEGVELSSDEEALVHAVGLALQWPVHGPHARGLLPEGTAGE